MMAAVYDVALGSEQFRPFDFCWTECTYDGHIWLGTI